MSYINRKYVDNLKNKKSITGYCLLLGKAIVI